MNCIVGNNNLYEFEVRASFFSIGNQLPIDASVIKILVSVAQSAKGMENSIIIL
jgi:hypothetical protein